MYINCNTIIDPYHTKQDFYLFLDAIWDKVIRYEHISINIEHD